MERHIRAETIEDYDAIDRINTLAFGQPQEAQLIRALRQDACFISELSLIAIQADQVVGHILFSPISIEGPKGAHPSLALAPMSVHPDFQRGGIGSQLVKAGLARAKALNHPTVIVLGHPAYYPRFGFQPAAQWDIHAPFEVPTEAFMALELEKGGFSGVSGTVKYPAAFQSV